MKPTLYTLLAAAAACGLASAAETSYSWPVGFVTMGNPAQSPAVPATTDVVVAAPLTQPTVFAGEVATNSDPDLDFSGTPGLGDLTTNAHVLFVKDGTEAGLYALITANDTDSVTLSVVVGTLANVSPGDTVSICPAWTAGTFIPATSVPPGTQLQAYDGTAPGLNLAASQILTSTGSNWVGTFGIGGLQDNFLIHPTESFVLRTGASPIATLDVTGEVPIAPHRTTISKLTAPGTGQDIRLSYFTATAEGVLESGIGNTPGDQILSFDNTAAGQNKAANEILTYTGMSWVGTFGIGGLQDAYPLEGGKGYVLRRASTAAAGDVDWTDVQNYIPSL